MKLTSMPSSMCAPSIPPPRVPPVHASQPPLLEHPDLSDLSAFGPEAMALGQIPMAPPTSPLCSLQEALMLQDSVIPTSSGMPSAFASLNQTVPSLTTTNTRVTSTAVQTDNKVITEKLQLIQGKLAKALKNANISLDSGVFPKELLQNVSEEITQFDMEGDEVHVPPQPFLIPSGFGELTPAEIEGLMVAEPAQTLPDAIGDMLSDGKNLIHKLRIIC